ncbi:MAG: histidine kinase, partial [Rhizobiales bacterium]|nr:histidine kinase [Rhizobacter sp.]
MPEPAFSTVAARSVGRACMTVLLMIFALCSSAWAADGKTLLIDRAVSVQSIIEPGSVKQVTLPVTLPDDWAVTRPRFEGSVWYRTGFDRPVGVDSNELMALYIERVCSNAEVYVNGHRVYVGGRMGEPVTRNCHYPQLITLPATLLQERGNTLDIQVQGHALQRVAARQRAGGLSAIMVGAHAVLASEYDQRRFWNITATQLANVAIAVLGCVMIGLGWMNRREAYLGYFGWLCLVWGLLSARVWWRDMPWDTGVMEFLFCTGFAPLVALAVQFLLSYAGVRSRWIENALAAQWVLLPATLLLAGPGRLFLMASIWYVILVAEVLAAAVLHLAVTWRSKRQNVWPMALLLGAIMALLGMQLVAEHGLVPDLGVPLLQVAVPLLFVGLA